jgi:ubiquinone biosynthesis protein Coq4/ribosomal protein S18 acetylase RimI-like enzyme
MEVPSMSWWRDRLRQLQGTSTIPGAAFESLSGLLDVFYCQLSGLDDFGAIAQLNRALIGTPAQAQMAAVLKTDPASAELIQERYLPQRYDRKILSNYPEGSLGCVYASYLDNSDLYPDLYSDLAVKGETSYIEARLGQTHDLWHLMTGLGTSVEDEIGLQAFHLAQFPYPLAAMLIANALVSYTLLEPEKLPHLLEAIERGWKLGKQAKPLFPQKWEEFWDKPIAQLRQELNLSASKHLARTPGKLNIRPATSIDIPFLARIEYEASLPPINRCFWEDLLVETYTNSLQFIEAMLRVDGSNWGNVTDFLILEEDGIPVAAAAGYTPNLEDYCPLRLSYLDRIAGELNWSDEVTATFGDRYTQFWGGDLQPIFFKPQAPWIIENVAVLPEARGRGLAKILLKALLEKGRSRCCDRAGITIINGNQQARHTYESIGFQPYQTFHSSYFADSFDIEFPGITKFTLHLN